MPAGSAPAQWFALLCAGVAFDAALGEPRRAHPLVGFGRIAEYVERRLNRNALGDRVRRRALGVLAVVSAVGVPVFAVAAVASHAPWWANASIQVLALYAALGARSLGEHARAVRAALARSDLERARALGARLVTRELSGAAPGDVARAVIESILENGNDAIFAPLFWFAIGGAPAVIAHRLANTLDAMWGYKTRRYIHFGWAAARLDDLLNYLPARLTALTYALLGNTRVSLACWRVQARAWESPNAGPVMAAGAGALGLELGGAARYHGILEKRPQLGAGRAPNVTDIDRALRLVTRALASWLAFLALLALGACLAD